MKPLTNKLHAAIDYTTVIVFFAAPIALGLTGWAQLLSYSLASVHLLMTVATNMPYSLIKLVPMRVHSAVELLVGPALIFAAFAVPNFSLQAQFFFATMGAAICLVWFLSEYKAQ
jgi:hypothetical protein